MHTFPEDSPQYILYLKLMFYLSKGVTESCCVIVAAGISSYFKEREKHFKSALEQSGDV